MASGRLPWQEAVEFGLALQDAKRPNLRAVRAARLAGGEYTGAGGLYVRVDGTRDGRPTGWQAAVAMTQTAGAGGMDAVTRSPLAILAHLMLTGRVHHSGVVATDAAVNSADVIPLLDTVGLTETKRLITPEPAPVDQATHPARQRPQSAGEHCCAGSRRRAHHRCGCVRDRRRMVAAGQDGRTRAGGGVELGGLVRPVNAP